MNIIKFLFKGLIVVLPWFSHGQANELSRISGYRINLGLGISGQFFLYSGENTTINAFLISQPYPNRSASGFGIPLFIEIYFPSGFGIEYSPEFRYDYIRHMDKNFTSNTNAIYELIIDHHLSLLYKIKKKREKVIGVGMSIIATKKGYDAYLTTSNPSGIYKQEYIDLQFEGIHALYRHEILEKCFLELKLIYIPPGSISYKPQNTFSIFPILSVKYRMINVIR